MIVRLMPRPSWPAWAVSSMSSRISPTWRHGQPQGHVQVGGRIGVDRQHGAEPAVPVLDDQSGDGGLAGAALTSERDPLSLYPSYLLRKDVDGGQTTAKTGDRGRQTGGDYSAFSRSSTPVSVIPWSRLPTHGFVPPFCRSQTSATLGKRSSRYAEGKARR